MKKSDVIIPAALLLLLLLGRKKKKVSGSATVEYLVTSFIEGGNYAVAVDVMDGNETNDWYMMEVKPGSNDVAIYSKGAYDFTLEDVVGGYHLNIFKNGSLVEMKVFSPEGIEIL